MVAPIGGGGGRDWVLAEEMATERRQRGKEAREASDEKKTDGKNNTFSRLVVEISSIIMVIECKERKYHYG
jgi:hypothetical protein